jgi:hypothetical protein
VADGVEKVRLAQTGLPVDEQGVVCLGRRLSDRDRSRMGKAVAGADDESLESVFRVQLDRFG